MNLVKVLILTVSIAVCTGIFSFGGRSIMNLKADAMEFTQVEALHILVPDEKEAAAIREEILKDSTPDNLLGRFKTAAKKYSKCPSSISGGDLGTFGRGVMVPEFEDAAFELDAGQISEPVRTQFGWHLIYTVSKR